MIVNSFRRRAAICAAGAAVVGALCVGVPIAHADDQYLGDLGANDMQNFCNKFSYYPSTAQVKRVDIGWECWPNDPNPFIQRIDVDFSVACQLRYGGSTTYAKPAPGGGWPQCYIPPPLGPGPEPPGLGPEPAAAPPG
jgi:hypothetical protein